MDGIGTSLLTDEKKLIQNHLEFLRTHRGKTSCSLDSFVIESDRKEFSFAFPSNTSLVSSLTHHFHTLYLLPSCWKFELPLMEAGFTQTGGLNYMAMKADGGEWKINERVEVRRAESENDFEEFSEVQARGFCDSEEEYALWHLWLRNANFRNRHNSSQIFYVAYVQNKPAGVALAIHHQQLTGIYAVTTLPEYRRQGVSITILQQVAHDSLQKGIENLTLQVNHGAYAEFFYQRLGFQSSFLVKIMSKQ